MMGQLPGCRIEPTVKTFKKRKLTTSLEVTVKKWCDFYVNGNDGCSHKNS